MHDACLKSCRAPLLGVRQKHLGTDAAHSGTTSMTTQGEIEFSKKDWKSLHETVVLEGKLKVWSAAATVISR